MSLLAVLALALLISRPIVAQVYTGNVIASETQTVPVTGGTATVNDESTTGVNLTITGLNGVTSVTATTELLSGPSPGEPPFSSSSGDVYIDVQVTLPPGSPSQPGATVEICTTNPIVQTGNSFHYWAGDHWAAATHVTVKGDTICGQVTLASLTGTNFVISALANPASSASGISVYVWLLVPVALVVIIGAAIWVMRSRRKASTS